MKHPAHPPQLQEGEGVGREGERVSLLSVAAAAAVHSDCNAPSVLHRVESVLLSSFNEPGLSDPLLSA